MATATDGGNGHDIEWVVAECDGTLAAALAREAGLPAVLGRLLVNRGISSTVELEQFLNPSLKHLHDPSLLPDMDAGVERTVRAIESGEKICIHGDYDVDGVTSAALLVRALSAMNANVEYRLPHRHRDGYDIKPACVEECAGSGIRLIITCDCGIRAFDTAERARELGVDLIITDHHEPGDVLPDAVAVVNPKRHDAAYPFPELAGVGVAFKFAQGIVRRMGFSEKSFETRFLDLVALGTVGDVVPLQGENRAIVKHGLHAIPASKKIGLQTMLKSTKLEGKPLTAYCLGFVLGPRINAVGRVDDASTALRLLLTRDTAEAQLLMADMERCNEERRAEQERIVAEAIELAASKDLDATRVLVLAHEGWNTGVVGIAASKVCEHYGRPAILLGLDPETGSAHGSARSTGMFNLFDGLVYCHDLLSRYGGHAMAAGVSLSQENLTAFEERINELAREVIADEDLTPRVVVEAELPTGDITHDLAAMLERMEPFGMGNPEPLFMTRGLRVLQRQRVGDGSHLRMRVQGDGGGPLQCIAFGLGDFADAVELGERVDLCYSIRLNRFNGAETVQLVGKGIRRTRAAGS